MYILSLRTGLISNTCFPSRCVHKGIAKSEICNIARCREIPKHWQISLFWYETFIHFLSFSLSTRGERDTQFLLCRLFLHRPQSTPQLDCPAQSQISTNLFFKITKNLSLSLPGMTSSIPQSHFLPVGFIMTFVIVISSAHERELYSMCAPALSRIVQSPTKPNDKI